MKINLPLQKFAPVSRILLLFLSLSEKPNSRHCCENFQQLIKDLCYFFLEMCCFNGSVPWEEEGEGIPRNDLWEQGIVTARFPVVSQKSAKQNPSGRKNEELEHNLEIFRYPRMCSKANSTSISLFQYFQLSHMAWKSLHGYVDINSVITKTVRLNKVSLS